MPERAPERGPTGGRRSAASGQPPARGAGRGGERPDPRAASRASGARTASVATAQDLPAATDVLRVRRATRDDLDAVVALRLALLRETPHNPVYGRLRDDAPTVARGLFRSQLDSSAEATYLAVTPAERIVGILRVMEGRGSPLLHPERYGYVASVYVVPPARGRGVLHRLMREAEAWCRARGLEELRLHTAADNPGGNAAWAALGFEVAEHLRVRRLER